MASNVDFVQYIVDQCSGAGEIVAKKMFGDYGIYCDGKIFGLICDDRLYIKPTEAGRALDLNDEQFQNSESDDDEDWDDSNGFDDEDYLLGLKLPKQKFIGTSKREFHIRIKLNNAPVNIWRELVVPSNITLELLAFVLIDAMGWKHEHLYQFRGKNNVLYMNAHEIREHRNSFWGFVSRVEYRDSGKTSLEMVLQPKAASKRELIDASIGSAEQKQDQP